MGDHQLGCTCIECVSRARRLEIDRQRQLAPHEARDSRPPTVVYEAEHNRVRITLPADGTITVRAKE